MIGAIMGDMIGAPYEFDRGNKSKVFPLFSRNSEFTDDSVMTVAVAEALMDTIGRTDDKIRYALIRSMQKWGRRYHDAGYGARFYYWLDEKNPEPYGSYGNGSAMRVSSAGWLFNSIEETRHMARLTAEVTHNHPEGIKGAEATASAIFLARNGSSKEDIKGYIISEFGYDLSRTCDEIRPGYHHVESCQQTVPEAVTAFLEGTDFEDVIRTAVSLGGDCDTLTCIAGSMAEAFYGVPEELKAECRKRLPKDMLAVVDRFTAVRDKKEAGSRDPFLDGNELIEKAIAAFHVNSNEETRMAILNSIRQRMHEDGQFIFPVSNAEDDRFSLRSLTDKDGKTWYATFTSEEEFKKGAPSQTQPCFIGSMLKQCLDMNCEGFVINPWGQSFQLAKGMINMIFEADGDDEYTVPDVEITEELLEDGSFLKRAIQICNRNRTQLNVLKLMKILRDSWVWVPCSMILSDTDYEAWSKVVMEAKEKGDLDSLEGLELTNQDNIRMVSDILQNGDDFYFPVFTSEEEMGEYGEQFSKVARHFLDAAVTTRSNEKDVKGIVINAFTEPFVVPKELFDVIVRVGSSIEEKDGKGQ